MTRTVVPAKRRAYCAMPTNGAKPYRSPSDARSKIGPAILGDNGCELDPTPRWADLLKGRRYEDVKHG